MRSPQRRDRSPDFHLLVGALAGEAHLDDPVFLGVAIVVDLELVEQVVVERALGRVLGLGRGEKSPGIHDQRDPARAGSGEGIHIGHVGLRVQLYERRVLVIGSDDKATRGQYPADHDEECDSFLHETSGGNG